MKPSTPARGLNGRYSPDGHSCKAGCDQRAAGPAAQWILRSADDENDQRLGSQRLDKPAGMKLRLIRVEEMQQHIEGQEIKDRADGSDEHHEIANQADIPLLGLDQVCLVDVVGRNRELGQVVKKIIEQDLRGKHGQEGQKNRRSRHAEYIAEVRTCAHQQILHHVAEGFASLDDAVMEDPQAGLNENHVGGPHEPHRRHSIRKCQHRPRAATAHR